MEKNNYRYNYIIIGGEGYYQVAFADLFKLPNVCFFSSVYDGLTNPFHKAIVKINYSEKVNQIIINPFGRIADRLICKANFSTPKDLCIIFFGRNYQYFNSSYKQYLKEQYGNVKYVIYFQDLICTHPNIDIEKVKKEFDIVLSYDYGESQRYGIDYYPTPFSFVPIPDNPSVQDSDVYFCGYAKTRYKQIFEVYEKCVDAGLKCDFNLFGLSKEERLYQDAINYIEPLSYMQNLQHVQKSKGVLEIMQINAVGYTPRVWECITFDKRLLTNNPLLENSRFYNFSNMLRVENVTGNQIKSFVDTPATYTIQEKMSLSPLCLLKYIENHLG